MAQKVHCKAQPACEEMQRVCLFFSGIFTISIKESLSNFKRNFFVPSDEVLTLTTSGTYMIELRLSFPIKSLPKFVMESKSITPLL